MGAQENKEVVHRFLTGVGSEGNPLEAFSPDVRVHLTGTHKFAGVYNGIQDLTERFFIPIMSQLESMGWFVEDQLIAEGDYVVAKFHAEGRMTKTGNPYNNQYLCIFKVEGGKITEMEEYADTAMVDKAFGPAQRPMSEPSAG